MAKTTPPYLKIYSVSFIPISIQIIHLLIIHSHISVKFCVLLFFCSSLPSFNTCASLSTGSSPSCIENLVSPQTQPDECCPSSRLVTKSLGSPVSPSPPSFCTLPSYVDLHHISRCTHRPSLMETTLLPSLPVDPSLESIRAKHWTEIFRGWLSCRRVTTKLPPQEIPGIRSRHLSPFSFPPLFYVVHVSLTMHNPNSHHFFFCRNCKRAYMKFRSSRRNLVFREHPSSAELPTWWLSRWPFGTCPRVSHATSSDSWDFLPGY